MELKLCKLKSKEPIAATIGSKPSGAPRQRSLRLGIYYFKLTINVSQQVALKWTVERKQKIP